MTDRLRPPQRPPDRQADPLSLDERVRRLETRLAALETGPVVSREVTPGREVPRGLATPAEAASPGPVYRPARPAPDRHLRRRR